MVDLADALCIENDVDFLMDFSTKHGREELSRAKTVCAACPVREACLEYALGLDPLPCWGVWAGLTYRELWKLAVSLERKCASPVCGNVFRGGIRQRFCSSYCVKRSADLRSRPSEGGGVPEGRLNGRVSFKSGYEYSGIVTNWGIL